MFGQLFMRINQLFVTKKSLYSWLVFAGIVLFALFQVNYYQNRVDDIAKSNLRSKNSTVLVKDAQILFLSFDKKTLIERPKKEEFEKFRQDFMDTIEGIKQNLVEIDDFTTLNKDQLGHIINEFHLYIQSYQNDQNLREKAGQLYGKLEHLYTDLDEQNRQFRRVNISQFKDFNFGLYSSLLFSFLIFLYLLKSREKIIKTESMLNLIASNSKDGFAVMEKGVMSYVSSSMRNILGRDEKGMKKEEYFEFVHPEYKQKVISNVQNAVAKKEEFLTQNYPILHKDGYYVWKEDNVKFEYDSEGNIFRAYIIARDVTETKKKESLLQKSEEKYRTFVELSSDMIFLKDKDYRYLIVNKNLAEFFGKSVEEVVGKTDFDLMSYNLAQQCRISDMKSFQQKDKTITEERFGDKVYETTKYIVEFANSRCLGGVIRDITQAQKDKKEIFRLAYYNPLTHIPNRQLFKDRLDHAIQNAIKLHSQGAVIMVDVDNFKIINDNWGHDKGDKLLQKIALRLKRFSHSEDTVAHFGGDDFVLLVENLSSDESFALDSLLDITQKLKETLQKPYQIDDGEYLCSVSIGVSLFSPNRADINSIIKEAELALYQAKEDGKNIVRFFERDMQERVQVRFAQEVKLRQAIKNGDFELYVQAQVDQKQNIIGAEALLRWNDDGYVVSPADFIPVLESSGLIVEVGYWVLEGGCEILQRWSQSSKTKHWTLSVNVSMRQFEEKDFVQKLEEILERYSFDLSLLKLELTENLFLNNTHKTIEKMEQIIALGIDISLDDFGTGYASLSYLRKIPMKQLKIDKSFVQDMFEDESCMKIIEMIVGVAKSLKISLVAEGVEQNEHFEKLKEFGVDYFQGFYIDKPEPVALFEKKHTLRQ